MEKATWQVTKETIKPAFRAAYERAQLQAHDGKVMVLELRPKKRSDDQSKKFHALCGDASKKLMFAGRKMTPMQWKLLYVSGHAQATGCGAELVTGLEGEMVNIREETARMGVARMASLIEYVIAHLTTSGIEVE